VEKSFFFLSNMKFCFMKRLFYTALEESMSVASQKKSAVVAGRVLNFALFFIGHEVLFYETTFSASALEH
jgi:hypothetical protein